MRDCTKWAIEALLKGDETITPKERAQWLQNLHGDSPVPVRPALVKFREAQAYTGLSRTTLQALADRGELERVFTSAGGKRCAGVSLASLEKWVAKHGGVVPEGMAKGVLRKHGESPNP